MAGLALLLAAALTAAAAGPKTAEPEARPNMRIVKRVDGLLPMGPAAAVIYEGGSSSELAIYVTLKGANIMIETQPGPKMGLAFDPAIEPFSDPYGGKVPTVAYRLADPVDHRRYTLTVLRYARPYFDRAGEFPQGELTDVDGDKKLDVVSRSRPLGRYFSAGCEDFEAAPDQAIDTRVWFFDKGRYVESLPRSKAYLERRLASDEAALEGAEANKAGNPAEYLSRALTVYFGRARLHRRDAWDVVEHALEPPRMAPGSVRDCLAQAKAQLRSKLGE